MRKKISPPSLVAAERQVSFKKAGEDSQRQEGKKIVNLLNYQYLNLANFVNTFITEKEIDYLTYSLYQFNICNLQQTESHRLHLGSLSNFYLPSLTFII